MHTKGNLARKIVNAMNHYIKIKRQQIDEENEKWRKIKCNTINKFIVPFLRYLFIYLFERRCVYSAENEFSFNIRKERHENVNVELQ